MLTYRKQFEGEDCIQCCPVHVLEGCAIPDCVHIFAAYVHNVNEQVYTGRLSEEVTEQLENLVGIMYFGVKEARDSGGVPQVDFGRSYIASIIIDRAVQESFYRTRLQEIYRVLHPFWESFKETCGCDEENVNRVDCLELDCLMTAIEEFLHIGLRQRPPYSLEEWRDGGLCGTCYQDCEGEDYIFEL